MKHYRTTGTLSVGPGSILELTTAQAHDRITRLDSLGDGRYCTKELMQFKRGEVLGIEGEIPKAHQELVESMEPVKEVQPVVHPSAEHHATIPHHQRAAQKKRR